MSDVTGIQRLRQAIENQAAAGEASFSLPVDEARATCDEVEDELARVSWAEGVPAPMDADGEVVPLTAKTMYTHSGREIDVNVGNPLSFDPDAGEWFVFFNGAVKDRCAALHLTRPDSWKRLEEDVDRIESGGFDPDECYYFDKEGMKCSECPAKDSRSCSHYIARDVMCRAKALAERDAKALTPQPLPHEAKETRRA